MGDQEAIGPDMPLRDPALCLLYTVRLKHQRLVLHQLRKPLAGLQAIAAARRGGLNPQNPDLHQTKRSKLAAVQSHHDVVAVQDANAPRVLAGYSGQAEQGDQ